MAQTTNAKRKLRILIADDVQETRRNTRLMVAEIDHVEVVAIAANGVQAVEFAREQSPDIVLMDINMPKMDGLSAYREIAKVSPNTGCIVLTAEKDVNALRIAMEIGVQEYLVKPFTVDELEAAIARVREVVEKQNNKPVSTVPSPESHLRELADEYTKNHRTDDQALELFEQLAKDPNCELRWLQTLSMIYLVRQKWGKLSALAERIEKRK